MKFVTVFSLDSGPIFSLQWPIKAIRPSLLLRYSSALHSLLPYHIISLSTYLIYLSGIV